MCERDGFIPRYYVDKPQDKVDRVIQDMQNYTHDLVTEEVGLGSLIENSFKNIQQEKEAIAEAAKNSKEDADKAAEDSLFNYDTSILKDSDFTEFNDFIEEEREEDEEL
jgi:hypothetical protein